MDHHHSRRSILRAATTGVILGLLPRSITCAAEATVTSPSASRDRVFYGVNSDPVYECESPDDFKKFSAALTELGAGTVRIPLRWIVAEQQHGKWDWSLLDRAVNAVPQQVEILGQFLSVPAWSTGVDLAHAVGWPDTYPPRDLADWANYVERTVARYKGRIHHWEIWNEENGIDFFRPQPDAEKYTEILKSAYQAAKRADPDCKVLLGGVQMNGVIANPWSPVKVPDFLKHVYQAGGGKFFDICNTHPYVLPSEGAQHMIDLTRDTRRVMADFGDQSKPLWLTEFGCGQNNGTRPEDQAKLLTDAYQLAAADKGIDRLYWFTLRDLAHDLLGPESSMGLVTHDWKPKLAFEAFQKLVGK